MEVLLRSFTWPCRMSCNKDKNSASSIPPDLFLSARANASFKSESEGAFSASPSAVNSFTRRANAGAFNSYAFTPVRLLACPPLTGALLSSTERAMALNFFFARPNVANAIPPLPPSSPVFEPGNCCSCFRACAAVDFSSSWIASRVSLSKALSSTSTATTATVGRFFAGLAEVGDLDSSAVAAAAAVLSLNAPALALGVEVLPWGSP
mmetsp:Transcript_31553/g.57555  ORF Transcript_31553/g.57555 Transcript_31553/m.57555 type:complete len:208 (+) Transcript_31553:499-1122(+)